jgi:hypothetical protein
LDREPGSVSTFCELSEASDRTDDAKRAALESTADRLTSFFVAAVGIRGHSADALGLVKLSEPAEELKLAAGGDPLEILVESEQGGLASDGLGSDEAVDGGGRDPSLPAGISHSGRCEVILQISQNDWKALHHVLEALPLLGSPGTREELLANDARNRERPVLGDHSAKPEDSLMATVRITPSKGGGEDRGVQEDHRFERSAL